MGKLLAKLKAKFWLLFAEKPKKAIQSFDSMENIDSVIKYLEFELSSNYNKLVSWAKGSSYSNNPAEPKKFYKNIKTLKVVLNSANSLRNIWEKYYKNKM